MHEEPPLPAAPEDIAEGSRGLLPDMLRKAGAAVVLAGAAAVSKYVAYKGLEPELPPAGRFFTGSGAHLLIGYMGAWTTELVSNVAAREPLQTIRTKAAAVGASALNLTTEIVQSAVLPISQQTDFLAQRNLPDTLRDYLFALGGLGIYLWRSRERGD